jgi:16S rRNA (guanine(966)-N(2))-methyltransferase RsmD
VRVIAGEAKGRRLRAVPGEGTRPITDRAKEALFSILGGDVDGARVLDMFAGTGSVGIEALSRGAAWCDFVDRAAPAVQTIRANLAHTGLSEQASVRRGDAFRTLDQTAEPAYDLIFVAPPQYHGLWLRALRAIDAHPDRLADGGRVVVQIHPREEEPAALQRLREVDRRQYGSVLLLFYALSAPDEHGHP